jgi:hypothetical protein
VKRGKSHQTSSTRLEYDVRAGRLTDMKATLLTPLALAAAGFFATPSHADPQVGVVFGVPGISLQIGAPVYAPEPVYVPPPVYAPPVVEEPAVVVADPYWVWVPGYGYRYWTRYECDDYERVHFVHLYRRGYEPGWREHERWWRDRGYYRDDRRVEHEWREHRDEHRDEHRSFEHRGYGGEVEHRGGERRGGVAVEHRGGGFVQHGGGHAVSHGRGR